MKKYLLEQKKYYKANLHGHTTISDGCMTPQQVKEHYKKLGYSIVAFTEHCFMQDFNSYLTDNDFVAINGYENAIYPIEKVEDYKYDTPIYHMCFYATDKSQTKMFGIGDIDFYRWHKKGDEDCLLNGKTYPYEINKIEPINKMIEEANKLGFLVQYNHPTWSGQTYSHYATLNGLWGLEIFNYDSYRNGTPEFNDHVAEALYRAGQKVCLTANDDSHDWNSMGGGFNYIGATTLTYEGVIDAMKRKDLYASCGPTFEYIYIENEKIYVKCSNVKSIHMTTDARYNRGVHFCEDNENKVIDNTRVGNYAEFWLPKDAKYVRFTIEDINGNRAWTRAYFAEEYK